MAERDRPARSLWLLLPGPVRSLPADLAAVIGLVLLTAVAVFVPGVNDTPLRVALGLPFVLFLPGYALIAALFPEAGESPTGGADGEPDQADAADEEDDSTDAAPLGLSTTVADRGIDGIERTALSVGLSVAVTPLIGLGLNFTPWGIRLTPIVIGISAFILGMVGVASVRRQALPPEERFRVPYRRWLAAAREEAFEPDSQVDAALNILLALSVLLAMGAVGYAIVVPPEGEQFSEFYLLTENEDGDRVAANYPTEFTLGESKPVIVGIGNQEHEPTEYTVVVQLQEVEHGPNETAALSQEEGERAPNETTVLRREELDRFSSPVLANNETWQRTYEIQPTFVGEDLRLQYLLYRGDPPAEPTGENAYRELHLWIDVEE